ncbi:hypothetical protein HanRHA438_Chr17g0839651 [Helianthus annuus]|nr:hypothetical protein HanRHA438_Chr17g0839651 [Helianthus annuus]
MGLQTTSSKLYLHRSKAVRFLKRVQQVVSNNTAHVKGQDFVFSRVGFAIQKGVAAQLVARLPAISL